MCTTKSIKSIVWGQFMRRKDWDAYCDNLQLLTAAELSQLLEEIPCFIGENDLVNEGSAHYWEQWEDAMYEAYESKRSKR